MPTHNFDRMLGQVTGIALVLLSVVVFEHHAIVRHLLCGVCSKRGARHVLHYEDNIRARKQSSKERKFWICPFICRYIASREVGGMIVVLAGSMRGDGFFVECDTADQILPRLHKVDK